MKYLIKTRNWNGKPFIKKLLDLSNVNHSENYGDNDVKYTFETNSLLKGLVIWLYFMSLRHWSGGWTYIINTNRKYNLMNYKSIYLN